MVSFIFISNVESPNTQKYLQMSIQDLCSSLKQEDPVEIKAVLEAILYRLFPEVLSDGEKKNVVFLYLVYYS